jgi:aryl-alcohol dehydrogenase-like predicted oxidoreductase
MEAVEASLRRLGTDYIDLYQVHRFDPLTNLEDTLRALDDLVRSGKVRYIGCSNFAAWQLMKALAISEEQRLERFRCTQSYYSLAGRELEREMIPLLRDQNLGLLVWSPLASGFLSGKFTRDRTAENARRTTLTSRRSTRIGPSSSSTCCVMWRRGRAQRSRRSPCSGSLPTTR